MERHWKKRETGKRWANKGKRGVKVYTGDMRTQEKLKTGESREKGEEIMVYSQGRQGKHGDTK